jgi:hypothetical protein
VKKLLVVVLVPLAVLAAVGAVAYVLLIGPIFALPVGVAVAESALATDDLILLAGLNVKHMVFLERWFLGRPVISVSNGRPLPEAADRGIVDHLRAAQVDPRGDVDYASSRSIRRTARRHTGRRFSSADSTLRPSRPTWSAIPRHPALGGRYSVLRGQRDGLGYLSARSGVDAHHGVELDPHRGSVIARHAGASSHEPIARGAG